MAVGPGDAPGPGQSQGGNQPARRGPRCRVGGQRPQPRATGLGRVFPPRQLGAEVRPARQLRPGAPGDLCQHQARTPRPELAAPLHQGVGRPAGDLPSQPENTAEDCACLTVNDVGKPGAGEPHARFDRGPLAKQQPWRAGIDAPTRETGGTEPSRLPLADQPAAYLTTARLTGALTPTHHTARRTGQPHADSAPSKSSKDGRARSTPASPTSSMLTSQ